MKILIVFTGGTIGSTVSDGYISTDNGQKYKLLEKYKETQRYSNLVESIEFEICEPYNILSENMNGEYIGVLCEFLKNKNLENYDGVVITHGTDTIQYTSAALAFYFNNIKIPMLLVSSNYVLEDERANGVANFKAAIEVIYRRIECGVLVPYQNKNGRIYLHYGERLLAHLPYEDDLNSVCDKYIGFFDGDIFVENECDKNNFIKKNEMSRRYFKKAFENWNSRIARIMPYPGMKYFDCSEVSAVILETYHSGTICATTKNLEEFFLNMTNMKIPVFLVGAYKEIEYESTKDWKKYNINVLKKSSPIAMYMKLWILLENGFLGDELIKEMNSCISREFV